MFKSLDDRPLPTWKLKLEVKKGLSFGCCWDVTFASLIFINVLFQLLEVSAWWEIWGTLSFWTVKKWGINVSTISWLFSTSPTGQISVVPLKLNPSYKFVICRVGSSWWFGNQLMRTLLDAEASLDLVLLPSQAPVVPWRKGYLFIKLLSLKARNMTTM